MSKSRGGRCLLSFLHWLCEKYAMFNHGVYSNTTNAAPSVAEEAPKEHGQDKQTKSMVSLACVLLNEGLYLTGYTTSREHVSSKRYLHRSLKVTLNFVQRGKVKFFYLPNRVWWSLPTFRWIYPQVNPSKAGMLIGYLRAYYALDSLIEKVVSAKKRAEKPPKSTSSEGGEPAPKTEKATKVKVTQRYLSYSILPPRKYRLPKGFGVAYDVSKAISKRDKVFSKIRELYPDGVFEDRDRYLRVCVLSIFEYAIKSGQLSPPLLGQDKLTLVLQDLIQGPAWTSSLVIDIKSDVESWEETDLHRLPKEAVPSEDGQGYTIPVRSFDTSSLTEEVIEV